MLSITLKNSKHANQQSYINHRSPSTTSHSSIATSPTASHPTPFISHPPLQPSTHIHYSTPSNPFTHRTNSHPPSPLPPAFTSGNTERTTGLRSANSAWINHVIVMCQIYRPPCEKSCSRKPNKTKKKKEKNKTLWKEKQKKLEKQKKTRKTKKTGKTKKLEKQKKNWKKMKKRNYKKLKRGELRLNATIYEPVVCY